MTSPSLAISPVVDCEEIKVSGKVLGNQLAAITPMYERNGNYNTIGWLTAWGIWEKKVIGKGQPNINSRHALKANRH